MKIPQETIDQIRSATDIVEYIGTFVRLKKRGKDYLGLCPFHNEKTPSFTVSPSKQLFYCFGCHRGGDIVKFVMEYQKEGYVEALETLAERAGIAITRSDEEYGGASETERWYSVVAFAARAFHRNLTQSSEGEFARTYFQGRGFTPQTITTFGLGYSLRGWESLVSAAKEEGITGDDLVTTGLARRRDDGTLYDAFRGRAMFPIFNAAGRVVGFGARKLYDDDTMGKYINSPETPIYRKSRILYGLSQAKESIRDRDFVILVEGYADLISVVQAGTKNIVATSGTALTPEQVQLIARYTRNVSLVFDADPAGAAAMMRGVDIILEGGLDVRIVRLPGTDDPDTFVRANGGTAFEELLAKAVSFIEYKASEYHRMGKLDTPEGKAEAVRGLVQSIAKVKDPLRRSFFIKAVAEKYSLYESTLTGELEKQTRRLPDHFTAGAASSMPAAPAAETAPPVPEAMPLEEHDLLSAILEDPKEMVPFVFRDIAPEDFSHPLARTIARAILDHFDEFGGVEVRELIDRMTDEKAKGSVTNITLHRYQLSDRWNAIGGRVSETRLYEFALGAIKTMRRKKIERELTAVRAQMKNASLSGADTIPFLKRQQELVDQMRDIDRMKLMKG